MARRRSRVGLIEDWRWRVLFVLTTLIVVALLISAHAWADSTGSGHDEAHHGSASPLAAELGGAYELTGTDGRVVSDATFRGGLVLIYFGYAGCGDVCPVALETMAHALDRLGTDADGVQPLFVDISDAKHNQHGTPPLDQWVAQFHPRLIGLTGTRRQLWEAVRKFKVRREHSSRLADGKVETQRINHTSRFYLIGRDGTTLAYVNHTAGPDALVALIRAHL